MFGSPWAVILAGGDGLRVSEITRGGDGRPTPKQYCRLAGQAPMVRWALDRAKRLVPVTRILVVVNEGHRDYWEDDLWDVPRHNLLVQPHNRGTAAGVLLALLTIQARADEHAPVVFLPSDHFVADESLLHDAIVSALAAAARGRADVVLLGMEPAGSHRDYGWILPSGTGALARVRQFVEKPPAEKTPQIVQAGGLVNSFVFAARAQALVGLFAQALPEVTRLFRAHLRYPLGVTGLHELYEGIGTTDLSREVFQRTSAFLSVVRVPACGWSDLGTPDRLQAYLAYAMARPRAAARAVAAA